ncbi:ABC transporter substrate-binding protein [Alkalicoccobacillus plakortidis]|uniref:ABC transporter substrate-binding protein n=1 Tax=Alkalicoccobacillus plakortidis TaxID=444060 RepID=A0ABT0XHY0_9BACI|nr:ABC transporter substrate-binding protein [Alkalicoccobacillus plakortidis]MCM2675360.1 ABC transporter substrate-binding protein [Alkalicoccobacillus plakortidis]
MNRHVLLLITMGLSISLVLTGCSGGSESTSSDEDQVTLRMSWWGSQSRNDMTLKIIDMYEAENPHVKIEPEFTGWDGYFERMAAQAAGNNLPDIMQQNFGEYLNLYASQGLLTDLSSFIEDGTLDVSQVEDEILQTGEKDGELLGIPTGTNALTVAYNKELLEGAGIDLPSNDWTWQDFKRLAEQVHSELGIYGSGSLGITNTFEYSLREKGYTLFNEDGTGLGYSDDQLLIDYLTFTKELVDADVIPGLDVTQQIQGLEDDLLVHKNSPFAFVHSNQVLALSSVADYSFDLNVLPGGQIEQGMYLKPSMLWSVSENSTQKEEAVKFIDYFVNAQEVYDESGSERGVPINNEIRENMRSDLSEVEAKIFDYIEYVSENSSPIDTNFPTEANEILMELEQLDERVMYGQVTPEEGAVQFREVAEMLLGNE